MSRYTIALMERYSGVSAHTIRIWEHRFRLFSPERTGANRRLYSIGQMAHLLDISLMLQNGYKISKLATMTPEELSALIDRQEDADLRRTRSIHCLMVAMLRSDVDGLDLVLSEAVSRWGIEATLEQVIVPFMERTELLSYFSNNSEVHFAVTALRQKMMLALEQPGIVPRSGKTALLFLAKGEHFDLMLLYMSYLLKQAGLKVYYLGTNVSLPSLKEAIAQKDPDYIYTYGYPGQKTVALYDSFLSEQERPAYSCVAAGLEERFTGGSLREVHYRDLLATVK